MPINTTRNQPAVPPNDCEVPTDNELGEDSTFLAHRLSRFHKRRPRRRKLGKPLLLIACATVAAVYATAPKLPSQLISRLTQGGAEPVAAGPARSLVGAGSSRVTSVLQLSNAIQSQRLNAEEVPAAPPVTGPVDGGSDDAEPDSSGDVSRNETPAATAHVSYTKEEGLDDQEFLAFLNHEPAPETTEADGPRVRVGYGQHLLYEVDPPALTSAPAAPITSDLAGGATARGGIDVNFAFARAYAPDAGASAALAPPNDALPANLSSALRRVQGHLDIVGPQQAGRDLSANRAAARALYTSLASLGQALGDSERDANMLSADAQLVTFVNRIHENPELFELISSSGKSWIEWHRRRSNGVALAGIVECMEAAGPNALELGIRTSDRRSSLLRCTVNNTLGEAAQIRLGGAVVVLGVLNSPNSSDLGQTP